MSAKLPTGNIPAGYIASPRSVPEQMRTPSEPAPHIVRSASPYACLSVSANQLPAAVCNIREVWFVQTSCANSRTSLVRKSCDRKSSSTLVMHTGTFNTLDTDESRPSRMSCRFFEEGIPGRISWRFPVHQRRSATPFLRKMMK